MRILTLTDLYPPVAFGGYEIDCASMVTALGAEHEMLVLTSRLDRDRVSPDPTVLRELPWAGLGRVVATAAAPVLSQLAAKTSRRVIEEFRPDLLIVCNGGGIPQSAILVALGSGVPVALRLAETFFAQHFLRGDRFLRHLQDEPDERGPLRAWGALVRLSNRLPGLQLPWPAQGRLAVAWASADLSSRVELPSALEVAHARVIHPTSSHAGEFSLLERRPFAEPTLLYLGRVTTDKGIEVAIQALAQLHARHGIFARLVVVGPVRPKLRRELEGLARRLGISSSLELRGSLPSEEFRHLVQGAHAIVVPSLVPDVFPLVVVEAALARLPIVASRVGGIPEAVLDREQALLFDRGDGAGCAAALADVLLDPGVADDRARRAFARMKGLSAERYAESWLTFAAESVATLGPPQER